MLSSQVGPATTSGGTGSSGNTTSGGTSGQTTSGGTSSGGTTSGAPNPGNCAVEKDDSSEGNPLTITTCARGAFNFPGDQEDWLKFERPKNTNFSANWTGPLDVVFWDDRGRSYTIKDLPNREGSYMIQIQYDFRHYPLSGDQLKKPISFDWTFEISFQ